MIYSSIDNERIKNIKKLNTKKYRDQEKLFLVEGEHLVIEASNSKRLKTLIVEENYSFNVEGVEKITCTSKVIKYISELDTPPKVLGICIKDTNSVLGNHIVALDTVQDPGNLGTIIRSSVAFNVDTLLLSSDTVDPYSPKVIRATQGMIFHINIVICDLKETLNNLKDYKKYGTKLTNSKSLKDIKIKDKYVIVMGNEGKGVKEEILNLCDEYISIDMNKSCESLNVAVATSIILYEINR